MQLSKTSNIICVLDGRIYLKAFLPVADSLNSHKPTECLRHTTLSYGNQCLTFRIRVTVLTYNRGRQSKRRKKNNHVKQRVLYEKYEYNANCILNLNDTVKPGKINGTYCKLKIYPNQLKFNPLPYHRLYPNAIYKTCFYSIKVWRLC